MFSKQRLLNVASGFFLFLAAAFALGRMHESNSLLHPSHERDYSPSEFGLMPEEVFFYSAGQKVHAWYFSGEPEKPTLLYLQGNAGTSANRLGAIKGYVDLGLNVFIYEPRGFGQSAGMAVRENFIEDSVSAYNYLVGSRKTNPDSIFILGQSLGGIPTLRLANSVKCKGIILEGTLVSIRQMAKDFYPNLPIWLLASSDFDNSAQVVNIKVPVLFIVGAADDIIAPYHSRKLYELAPNPKELVLVEGAAHTDMFKVNPGLYYGAIAKFTGLAKKTS
jgi:hypothetical protein